MKTDFLYNAGLDLSPRHYLSRDPVLSITSLKIDVFQIFKNYSVYDIAYYLFDYKLWTINKETH